METSSIPHLVEVLAPHRNGIVSIDGRHGVGKTTLAREIAGLLGMRVVHVDEFLTRNRGGFVDFVDYTALAVVLTDRNVLVEGVCMLEVLGRLALRADAMVYVRETSPLTRGKLDVGALATEVASYERRHMPEQVASVVFVRPSGSGANRIVRPDEAQVDVAFINSKTKLAITLAIGGMLTLVVGLFVMPYGVERAGNATVKVLQMEVSASGMGAVIMVTSSIWAYFAYKARPQYARRREVSETFDEDAQLRSRTERESSTQVGVEVRPDADKKPS